MFDEYFYPYLFEDSDYAERVRIYKKNNNAEMVDIDDVFDKSIGDGTTVSSDSKIKEKYVETYKKTKNYFDLKVSQNFQKTGEWDIDVRRSQEWL